MFIFKNAWTSIKRNKGRNILIAIIVIVIASACAITLSIMNSANKIVQAYEDKYQIKATIGMNRDYLMQKMRDDNNSAEERINYFNNIDQVSVEQIDAFGNSDYVKDYFYTYSLGMNANGISEAADQLMKESTETTTHKKSSTTRTEGSSGGSSSSQGGGAGQMPGGGMPGRGQNSAGGNEQAQSSQQSTSTTTEETTTETRRSEKIENKKAQDGVFTLVGYNSYSSMTEFVDGTYTISDGEVNSDFSSNSCVISKEVADLNSLIVGSEITFVDPKDTNHTYVLKVTGIYTENSESSGDMSEMFSNSANSIITNSTVIQNIIAGNSNLTPTITPTFILKNSDCAEPFANEVKTKGLSDYYTVSNNLSVVQSATEGVTNVGTFAFTFLIITLIIGGVVLFVINLINIRERKYEIGVLRTIGMSKLRVIWQFVLELIIIALIGLLIGAGIGAASSVSVSNKLLETEIQKTQTQMESINNNFGGGMGDAPGNNGGPGMQGGPGGAGGPGGEKFNGTTSVSQVSDINAVVDFVVLAQLLGLGLALTILSSLSACIAIARFSPLEILRERS